MAQQLRLADLADGWDGDEELSTEARRRMRDAQRRADEAERRAYQAEQRASREQDRW